MQNNPGKSGENPTITQQIRPLTITTDISVLAEEAMKLLESPEVQEEFEKIEEKNKLLTGPNMPQAWIGNSELVGRYNILLEVIKEKPDWWIKRKDKIELRDNGIDFKELELILDLNDIFPKVNWLNLTEKEKIPVLNELEYIKDFVYSVRNGKNYNDLRYFLGFDKYYQYGTSTVAIYDGRIRGLDFSCSDSVIISVEEIFNFRKINRYIPF